jgi:hypothetical protein
MTDFVSTEPLNNCLLALADSEPGRVDDDEEIDRHQDAEGGRKDGVNAPSVSFDIHTIVKRKHLLFPFSF